MSNNNDNNTCITSDTFVFGLLAIVALAIFLINADYSNPQPNQKTYAEDPNQIIYSGADIVPKIGVYNLPIGTYTVVSSTDEGFTTKPTSM